jgi:hypothetical protein
VPGRTPEAAGAGALAEKADGADVAEAAEGRGTGETGAAWPFASISGTSWARKVASSV